MRPPHVQEVAGKDAAEQPLKGPSWQPWVHPPGWKGLGTGVASGRRLEGQAQSQLEVEDPEGTFLGRWSWPT